MIVEYECPNCDKKIEELAYRSRVRKTIECPKCKTKMKHIMSAPHFKVKGYTEANGYS